MPTLGGTKQRLDTIAGSVPNPARFPSGCKFHTRCPRTRALAQAVGAAAHGDVVQVTSGGESFSVLQRCQGEEPQLRELQPQHWAACHQTEEYDAAPLTTPILAHKRTVTAAVAVDDATPMVEAGVRSVEEIRSE